MTALDEALQKCIDDPNEQNAFYDLVLNTSFYIPTDDEEARAGKTDLKKDDALAPIIVESDGKKYMMLFDSEERLSDWAKESVTFALLPGHVLARMTPPYLHWALNVGTKPAKEFVPDEIAWLKSVVEEIDSRE